ncbi:MAG: ACP S-malonyltransferase [Ruminococcus sp.]
MATIALFSGQGSQYEKMGLDLVNQDASLKEIYETASEVLGFDLYAIIADSDAQTLARTIYAQPAIMATSLVCLEAAKKKGFTYDAVAGHSLGEYAAMVASGMLSLEDGFRVIKARSEAMDAAASAADGAMCAILKLAPAEVERICAETEGYVVPANYNSSVQTVIAGDRDAVEKAAAACTALKARAVPLAVASAFHTKLMQPAADAFYESVKDVTFHEPNVTFYSNVLGTARTDFSDMASALAAHIVSPVRFTDELAAMQSAGIDTFVEFGPKNVLTGLVKKTLKGVTAKNCENCETLEGVFA